MPPHPRRLTPLRLPSLAGTQNADRLPENPGWGFGLGHPLRSDGRAGTPPPPLGYCSLTTTALWSGWCLLLFFSRGVSKAQTWAPCLPLSRVERLLPVRRVYSTCGPVRLLDVTKQPTVRGRGKNSIKAAVEGSSPEWVLYRSTVAYILSQIRFTDASKKYSIHVGEFS